ncbi:MAG: HD domain-containing protein [Clostridia bacterium]|nr:HD domain-containing protein [Clostridia bacterium]
MSLKDEVVKKMKEIFGSDERRINHALKVLRFSEQILLEENMSGDIEKIVCITAILHDIGIHEAERKYNSNSGNYQEIEGPPIARSIMEELDIDTETMDRVCYIIGGHHTASKNNGVDFQIIWEADLLVNIEEDGLAVDNPKLKGIIDKNFKTSSARKLAESLYLK